MSSQASQGPRGWFHELCKPHQLQRPQQKLHISICWAVHSVLTSARLQQSSAVLPISMVCTTTLSCPSSWANHRSFQHGCRGDRSAGIACCLLRHRHHRRLSPVEPFDHSSVRLWLIHLSLGKASSAVQAAVAPSLGVFLHRAQGPSNNSGQPRFQCLGTKKCMQAMSPRTSGCSGYCTSSFD